MPEISRFYGIRIVMYYDEHFPPHFHAQYGEHEAQVAIATSEVIRGTLPARALAFVREWSELHRSELEENWQRRENSLPPNAIEPLP